MSQQMKTGDGSAVNITGRPLGPIPAQHPASTQNPLSDPPATWQTNTHRTPSKDEDEGTVRRGVRGGETRKQKGKQKAQVKEDRGSARASSTRSRKSQDDNASPVSSYGRAAEDSDFVYEASGDSDSDDDTGTVRAPTHYRSRSLISATERQTGHHGLGNLKT